MDAHEFRVAVAVQNDHSCHEAVNWAIDLCKRLGKDGYKLYFVYAVAQNPTSRIPILDRMERGFNLEIHEEAKRDVRELLEYLDNETCTGIDYEFVKLEKQAEVQVMITEFIESYRPNVLVVGSHPSGPLKKYAVH